MHSLHAYFRCIEVDADGPTKQDTRQLLQYICDVRSILGFFYVENESNIRGAAVGKVLDRRCAASKTRNY